MGKGSFCNFLDDFELSTKNGTIHPFTTSACDSYLRFLYLTIVYLNLTV